MIIRPDDIHLDVKKALAGVNQIADELGVKADCRFQSAWRIDVEDADRRTFIEMAKEAANAII
jgi:hypothetical protein